MSRSKLELPEHFPFSISIPIRITDLNYGGHVGNDSVLSLIHEARMQYLKNLGYTEMDVEGVSLIMSQVTIEFKAELFYGDTLTAFVAVKDVSRAGFDIYYKLLNGNILAAVAKTAMVCYNYGLRKVVSIPEKARHRLVQG